MIKDVSLFYKNKRMSDGCNTYCIECHKLDNITRKKLNRAKLDFKEQEKESKRKYRLQTVDQRRQYMQAWRRNNPNRAAEYYLENIQRIKEYRKIYAAQNKSKINAKTRKRQAAKINRTPAWMSDDELWLIEEFYHLAQMRTKMYGVAWHVDHIIPLQGSLVCGLHVPDNLQVIPAKQNYVKSNKFEVSDGFI